jgi:hypothetical protein
VDIMMKLRRQRETVPTALTLTDAITARHCERSEAIQGLQRKNWIASSLRSSQ